MNGVSNPDMSFTEEESETESIPDEHYEPLSNAADEEEEEEDSSTLVNGHVDNNGINNCLDLSEDEDEDEDEAEEERMREAMQRAFREDEMRRRAPLTEENSNRVIEAMRGILFPGLTPNWASDDRWIDQLPTVRQSNSSSS